MTPEQKFIRLKMMGIASLAGFSTFMAVWIAGCYVADFVLRLSADSWRMLFGYVVGCAGMIAMHAVSDRIKRVPPNA